MSEPMSNLHAKINSLSSNRREKQTHKCFTFFLGISLTQMRKIRERGTLIIEID
jgi:hypothetical protein